MGTGLYEQLELTWMSFKFFIPEVVLIVCYSIASCRWSGETRKPQRLFTFLSFSTFLISLLTIIFSRPLARRQQTFFTACFEVIASRHT